MDEHDRLIAERRKFIRGYIIRSLLKGNRQSLILGQLTRIMMEKGVVLSPDISEHLDYLIEGGYIRVVEEKINAFSAYRDDAVIKLTKKGADLVDGYIEEPGVDI